MHTVDMAQKIGATANAEDENHYGQVGFEQPCLVAGNYPQYHCSWMQLEQLIMAWIAGALGFPVHVSLGRPNKNHLPGFW